MKRKVSSISRFTFPWINENPEENHNQLLQIKSREILNKVVISSQREVQYVKLFRDVILRSHCTFNRDILYILYTVCLIGTVCLGVDVLKINERVHQQFDNLKVSILYNSNIYSK